VLFVIGSALTVAVFFLALWLEPWEPFTAFLSHDFLERSAAPLMRRAMAAMPAC
jgi:hypothetical protein